MAGILLMVSGIARRRLLFLSLMAGVLQGYGRMVGLQSSGGMVGLEVGQGRPDRSQV